MANKGTPEEKVVRPRGKYTFYLNCITAEVQAAWGNPPYSFEAADAEK